MRVETAFRLSFYATLAIACVGLGVAELYFVPWMVAVSVLGLGLIVVAYRQEGRWALSEDLANILGLTIGVVSLAWIYFQVPHSEEEFIARGIPWPAGLLPHVGPLLMGLLLVKMFRPKRPADFWSIQLIGLMMMTLGCVLTGEFFFGVLLVAYFACVLWCLAMFYAYRGQQACEKRPAGVAEASADALNSKLWPILGLGQALRRASVMLPLGFLLFLLAPRRTDSEWIPYRLSTTREIAMRTGAPADLDLNRVGKIELSEKPVFTVTCVDAQNQKYTLPPEQRFRTTTLDNYRSGRFSRLFRAFLRDHRDTQMRLRTNTDIPDFGDKQIRFDFIVNPHKAGNFALAEPVLLGSKPGDFPYVRLDEAISRNLFFELAGTGTLMPFPNPLNKDYRYRQASLPMAENQLVPARQVSSDYLRFLQGQRVPPEFGAFTRALLPRLSSLKPQLRTLTEEGEVPPQHQLEVAKALEDYFLSSGEFGYSLNLRRVDPRLDPTLDFLTNVKQGHCERFAAALTLMLRSVGIPARLVVGFRGVEMLAEGEFEVREKHAHSWVEALVSDEQDPTKLYWLTLDPTPANELVEMTFSTWLAQNWNKLHVIWRELIVEWDTSRQLLALASLWRELQEPDTWVDVAAVAICVAAGVVAWIAYRRQRARRRRLRELAAGAVVPFYERFLEVAVRRAHIQPQPDLTPREIAAAATAHLAALALPPHLLDVPGQVVAALYRIRYGGRRLGNDELAEIDQSIAALDLALQPFSRKQLQTNR